MLIKFQKLNTLDLAIRTLTSSIDPQKILTNPSSKPEELIIAQIKLCKGVKDSIQSVREKLDLDNASGWQNIVKEFGRKIKLTAKDKARKLKIIKKIKEKKSKKGEKVKLVKDENGTATEEGSKTETSNGWIVEDINVPNVLISDPKNNEDLEKIREATKKNANRKTKENAEEKKNVEESKIIEKITKEDIPEPPIKSLDSFFFTSSGRNYMATAVPERPQTNEESTNQWPDRKPLIHDNNRKFHNQTRERNRPNFHENPSKPSFDKRRTNLHGNSSKSPFDKRKNENNDLHPSWLAKRQNNGAIGKFEGKKIKFDEEPKVNAVIDGDSKIHPSWAAKQKQKPIISEFKGTKIKFDDD